MTLIVDFSDVSIIYSGCKYFIFPPIHVNKNPVAARAIGYQCLWEEIF
jgi:hypothetical protein